MKSNEYSNKTECTLHICTEGTQFYFSKQLLDRASDPLGLNPRIGTT